MAADFVKKCAFFEAHVDVTRLGSMNETMTSEDLAGQGNRRDESNMLRKTILSVSCDEEILCSPLLALEPRGYKITSASNFDEAAELCGQRGFQLLVLGQAVPYAEKLALIEAYRAKRPLAPVISLRRNGQPMVEAAQYNAVADDPGELLSIISIIFNGYPAPASFYTM